MLDKSAIILDIETTGLSAFKHKITEIAAVKIENGSITKTFHTLINPETRIPSFITKLTGITDEMVKDAPTMNTIVHDFLDFLGEHPIIAHNASFDMRFLEYNIHRHTGLKLQNDILCTYKLANRLLPELPSKRLSSICEYYDIELTGAHRALNDVHATIKILEKFCSQLHNFNIKDVSAIKQFQNMPRSKVIQLYSTNVQTCSPSQISTNL